ncbi:MAG: outer membrane protein [Mesorhizobium sp.]|nr:porin family protein [Mesorhizobium sp.]
MLSFARKAAVAGVVAALASPVFAADLIEPPVEPAPVTPVYQETEFGGWYIRGDVDYHWSKWRGADYITYGPPPGSNSFSSGKLRGAFSLGGGVGYQVTRHFRTDVTGDYWFKTKFEGGTTGTCGSGEFCTSRDSSHFSALLLLANAYADLGTWHGVTPYVGAGIGGAHVKWDSLINDDDDGSFEHRGAKGWRFAYALMAGASYCLTDRAKLDLGYRFSHIEGGRMFEYSTGAGPGFDKGLNTHEVRAGLRYQFGNSDCAAPQAVAYEPEPEPIYTK